MTPIELVYEQYKCHRSELHALRTQGINISGTLIALAYTTYEGHSSVAAITQVYTDGNTDGEGHAAGESGW